MDLELDFFTFPISEVYVLFQKKGKDFPHVWFFETILTKKQTPLQFISLNNRLNRHKGTQSQSFHMSHGQKSRFFGDGHPTF